MFDSQIDLFWEFPSEKLANPAQNEETATQKADLEAPASEESMLLRRVAVDPVAMARALVLIKSFAAKHGLDPQERGEVAMFVRERDILLAADWDRDHTRTVDGQPRPFRFRYSVPLVRTGEGRALWAGVRIRPQDLQEAFRNRVENSDQYGVLSSNEPVWLEVLAPAPDKDDPKPQPARIIVHPSGDRRTEPREVFALGGASLHAYEDVEPVLADAGLPGLDADTFVDLGAFADEAIGIRIHPWNHKTLRADRTSAAAMLPAYAVGISARGVAVSTFDSPLTETLPSIEQQFDILSQQVEAKRTPVPQGKALAEDIVLTPRFADVLGITQGSFEEAMRVVQRSNTADWELKMAAAAVAATLDRNLELIRLLRERIGGPIVAAAMQKAAKSSGQERAIAVTRALQEQLEPADIATLGGLLSVSKDVNIEPYRVEFEDDAALVRIAGALSGGSIDEAGLARLIGDVLLTREAKSVISRSGHARPTEVPTSVDLALAALRLAGKSYRSLAEEAVTTLAEPMGEWWEAYENYMTGLGVPREAIEAVTRTNTGALRTERPSARHLRAMPKLREQWIAQARVPVQGRIWRGHDGRCWAGFGHEDVGYVWFSDMPVQPDPAKYPLTHDEVARLIARSLRPSDAQVQWQGTVYHDDLQSVVNRVVGLISPESEVSPKALLVVRWTPADLDQSDGALPKKDERFANPADMLRPMTVYLGEGASAERFEVDPPYPPENVRPKLDGTLRIYGFEPAGEALWFDVPLYGGPDSVRPEGREPGEPYAFALDADGLHDAIDFIGRRGMSSTINLLGGVVRVHDPQMRRILFLPTIERSRVPEVYRPALRAAGVPAELCEKIALVDIIRQARIATVPVNDEPRVVESAYSSPVVWLPDPGVLVTEDVYTKAVFDPFVRQEILLNEIARLRRQLAPHEDKFNQLAMFDVSEPVVTKSHKKIATQLQKKLEELERLQQELPAHMQFDPGIRIGEVRPGQSQRRFVTPAQIEEETDIGHEEIDPVERAPRIR